MTTPATRQTGRLSPRPFIGDGLVTIGADGLVASVNPAAQTMIGRTQNDAVGLPLAAVFRIARGGGERIDVPSATAGVVTELPPDTVLTAPDGTEWRIEGSVSPTYGRGGEFAGVALIFRDATERARLGRECREQLADLTDLNRRKDESLAMLAHELRNPLAPLRNAVLILGLEGNDTPARKRALALIDRQVEQLARLIDDLLDVSCLASGRARLRPERLDLRTTVALAVESTRAVLDRKGHDLTVALPRGAVVVSGDPSRLEQVVVNLLNNAAKYTDPGGRITLTLRSEGDVAVLRLRDSGVGIDAATLPHVFDLFFQADGIAGRSEGGSGIGLALVRRLVQLHGGTVTATSAGAGKGSEFTVRLPLLPAGRPIRSFASAKGPRPEIAALPS